jgi:hypothetical protein
VFLHAYKTLEKRTSIFYENAADRVVDLNSQSNQNTIAHFRGDETKKK